MSAGEILAEAHERGNVKLVSLSEMIDAAQ